MNLARARLAAFLTVALTFTVAARLPSFSSRLEPESETNSPPGLDGADARYHKLWLDPLPGTKPLSGLLQDHTLDVVGKRDCLANGSNYCFGNTIDFCNGCGNCCLEGRFCCGSGKQCCGSGCCSDGEVCSEGKCLASV